METQLAQMEKEKKLSYSFSKGIGLTLLIALTAYVIASIPYMSIFGPLVLAILIGMLWRGLFTVPLHYSAGITFSSKILLRAGIVLLGMRLNYVDIYEAGGHVIFLSIIVIAFTLPVVYGLSKWLKVPSHIGILTACGTAICGAAAIAAISSQIKSKEEETAVSIAIIALSGTAFTIIYTVLYPLFPMTPEQYGLLAGGTLHEIAHVIAAAAPGGEEALDMAVIMKLTRVLLLIPVAFAVGIWQLRRSPQEPGRSKKDRLLRSLSIPWFITGFLITSGLNTLGIFHEQMTTWMVAAAYMLMAMAMAGLGLNVEMKAFKKFGKQALIGTLSGSVLLSLLGFLLVFYF
jgi:uncharacterized integral membrane protein (TIGR00698 family)